MGSCLSRCHQEDEERVMDPFKAVGKSQQDLILQHLSGNELLQASEVSPKWFLTIAKSKVSMKKVELIIVDCEEAIEDKILAIALTSPRRYENLYVCSQNKKKVISRFAESLSEIRVCSYDVKVSDLKIPNLKKLFFDGDALSNGLMSSSSSLEELKLKSIRHCAADSVVQCLKANKNLKVLGLGASPSVLFREDLSATFDFHLTSLSAKLYFIPETRNFFNFLTSQAESLQHLTVHVNTCDNSAVFNAAINGLQKLQRLEIFSAAEVYGFKQTPPHDLPDGLILTPNESIEKLRVERLRLKNLTSLKLLLAALPNLQSLRVLDTTKDALLLTIENAEKLSDFQTLHFKLLIVHDVEESESNDGNLEMSLNNVGK